MSSAPGLAIANPTNKNQMKRQSWLAPRGSPLLPATYRGAGTRGPIAKLSRSRALRNRHAAHGEIDSRPSAGIHAGLRSAVLGHPFDDALVRACGLGLMHDAKHGADETQTRPNPQGHRKREKIQVLRVSSDALAAIPRHSQFLKSLNPHSSPGKSTFVHPAPRAAGPVPRARP